MRCLIIILMFGLVACNSKEKEIRERIVVLDTLINSSYRFANSQVETAGRVKRLGMTDEYYRRMNTADSFIKQAKPLEAERDSLYGELKKIK